MNKLPRSTRTQILHMLVEGSSMRSISRITGVSINTVTKLLVDAGNVCAEYHDKHLSDVPARRIQCDEIWSFCYAKEKTVVCAEAPPEVAFGGDVDCAELIKLYCSPPVEEQRCYSPAHCMGTETNIIAGNPHEDHISMSHVERRNLTMRMSMRRLTRLTNSFSNKIENHCHALALYFTYYNFCGVLKTLKQTPAQAAGLTDLEHTKDWIVDLIDTRPPKPKRGPYKSRKKIAILN